jgi:hypothetical protein
VVSFFMGMTTDTINDEIRKLVEAWCDRREYGALASLLAPWISNNGLTDGWEDLAAALRSTANSKSLPDNERFILKQLWVELDTILRNR